jgi:Metallo-beta-lactamase superfamily
VPHRSILILSPDGKVVLIDGRESNSGALAYLKAKGITHVDLMAATHPHSDHIGGLVGVKADKAVYKEAKRGDTLTLGSLGFRVLHPDVPIGEDLNAAFCEQSFPGATSSNLNENELCCGVLGFYSFLSQPRGTEDLSSLPSLENGVFTRRKDP